MDARGLRCPAPILAAARALRSLPAGAVLQLSATDPAIAQDLPAFCEAAGHTLVEWTQRGPVWIGRVRKG